MAFDPTWIAVGIVGVTSVAGCLTAAAALRRNGKSSKEKIETDAKVFGALMQEVKHINEAVHDETHGLQALSKEIGGVRTHCGEVTGGFTEQIKAHEKRLNGLEP